MFALSVRTNVTLFKITSGRKQQETGVCFPMGNLVHFVDNDASFLRIGCIVQNSN
jgi:hypothetical protein